MLQILILVIVFAITISAIVAAHEYGHFLAARSVGIEVEEFAIGFGKPKWIYGRNKETDFTLRPVPLGGFVLPKGSEPKPDGSEIDVPNGLYNKAPWTRIWVAFAGPLFSLIFGVILLTGIYTIVGEDVPSQKPVVGMLVKNMPAERAGMKLKDKIISVDQKPISNYYEFLCIVREKIDQPVEIKVERDSKLLAFKVTPESSEKLVPILDNNLQPTKEEKVQGRIGIQFSVEKHPIPFGEALSRALQAPVKMGKELLNLFSRPERVKNEVGSILSIGYAISQAIEYGIPTIVSMCAALSISIGYMNLLPILPLDGGQILISLIEVLRGNKRLSFKYQTWVNNLGMVLFAAIALSVTYLDIERFVTGKFKKTFQGKELKQEK